MCLALQDEGRNVLGQFRVHLDAVRGAGPAGGRYNTHDVAQVCSRQVRDAFYIRNLFCFYMKTPPNLVCIDMWC